MKTMIETELETKTKIMSSVAKVIPPQKINSNLECQALLQRPKKKKNKAQGIFRATVNDTQQVLPSQPPQLKKHKAPELSPLVDANTSTKHTKTSKSGSLVPNWRQKANVGILNHIAHKHLIEFVNEEDIVEGEFDKVKGLETLYAVCASKPFTVRVDKKLVHGFHIWLDMLTIILSDCREIHSTPT
jgi:hypothetical protein